MSSNASFPGCVTLYRGVSLPVLPGHTILRNRVYMAGIRCKSASDAHIASQSVYFLVLFLIPACITLWGSRQGLSHWTSLLMGEIHTESLAPGCSLALPCRGYLKKSVVRRSVHSVSFCLFAFQTKPIFNLIFKNRVCIYSLYSCCTSKWHDWILNMDLFPLFCIHEDVRKQHAKGVVAIFGAQSRILCWIWASQLETRKPHMALARCQPLYIYSYSLYLWNWYCYLHVAEWCWGPKVLSTVSQIT